MELQVSGKLKTASTEQRSFKGFRIEASFDRKSALPPSRPSASKSATGRAFVLDDATAPPIETSSKSVPYQTAAATEKSEASIPSRVSARSDDAGNFTLVFPDQYEIVSDTVKFTVSLPAGRIIREMEVMMADLGEAITIEVEAFENKLDPKVNTPQAVAVDVLFQTDAALRQTITKNLRALRGESELIAARVEKAWKFNPSQLPADELERRHHVARGTDPYKVLEAVVMRGVDALNSTKMKRTLTLRNSAELKKLIKYNDEPADSLQGVVELGPLIEFIQRRGVGPIEVAELTSTSYRAEAEADDMLDAVGNSNRGPVAKDVAALEGSSSGTGGADELVKSTVNIQMQSATAPESQLVYGKIPNNADEDKVQSKFLESFQLKPLGPTDVTSYHDFHTLQIAFEHVWTEIFDGQLATLGRDLYSEYVKLKDFSGSTQPDLQVGTLADLKLLIEEIKKLSQFVQEDIPSSLRPEGGGQTNNDRVSVKPEDVARFGGAVATGGVSLFIEWAFNELIKLGNKPEIIAWNSFPISLKAGSGNIIELLAPEKIADYQGLVEIVLETDANSYKKRIMFQQWDSDAQRPIYNAEIHNSWPDRRTKDSLVLNASQLASGTLKFVSEDEFVNELLLGRYVLGDLTEVLKDSTKVTFRWKGQR
jgi:hypothetical protein